MTTTSPYKVDILAAATSNDGVYAVASTATSFNKEAPHVIYRQNAYTITDVLPIVVNCEFLTPGANWERMPIRFTCPFSRSTVSAEEGAILMSLVRRVSQRPSVINGISGDLFFVNTTKVADPPSPISEPEAPLRQSLDALSRIKEYALEDECEEPSDEAIENARILLKIMYGISPIEYDIYTMGNGAIGIDGGHQGSRVIVFCDPDGSVQYLGAIDSEKLDLRRTNIEDIPQEFLRKALEQLED